MFASLCGSRFLNGDDSGERMTGVCSDICAARAELVNLAISKFGCIRAVDSERLLIYFELKTDLSRFG